MPDSEPVIVGLSNTTSSGDGSPVAYTDSESGVIGLESMNDDPPCIVGMGMIELPYHNQLTDLTENAQHVAFLEMFDRLHNSGIWSSTRRRAKAQHPPSATM